MRNVECAGRDLWSPVHGQIPGKPCGWKGERQSLGGLADPRADPATKKPCPRCGGRVELIEVGS